MPVSKPAQSRPALLVVEDDDSIREAIAYALGDEGYEIVVTDSGEEALSLICAVSPFVGLYTDINLLGAVTGWDVGAAFRERCPAQPIVYASGRMRPEARMMPGSVFLQKPFDLMKLVDALIR